MIVHVVQINITNFYLITGRTINHNNFVHKYNITRKFNFLVQLILQFRSVPSWKKYCDNINYHHTGCLKKHHTLMLKWFKKNAKDKYKKMQSKTSDMIKPRKKFLSDILKTVPIEGSHNLDQIYGPYTVSKSYIEINLFSYFFSNEFASTLLTVLTSTPPSKNAVSHFRFHVHTLLSFTLKDSWRSS